MSLRRSFTTLSVACLVWDKCHCHKENKKELKLNCPCRKLSRFFCQFWEKTVTILGAMSLVASVFNGVVFICFRTITATFFPIPPRSLLRDNDLRKRGTTACNVDDNIHCFHRRSMWEVNVSDRTGPTRSPWPVFAFKQGW